MPTPRVVIDTNVVLSALIFGGRLSRLRRLWSCGDVTPLICRETTTEFLRVLAYPKFRLNKREQEALREEFLPYCEVVKLPEHPVDLPVSCRDRDDMVFLALSVFAQADYLISGDRDLAALRANAPVAIVSPAEFLVHFAE